MRYGNLPGLCLLVVLGALTIQGCEDRSSQTRKPDWLQQNRQSAERAAPEWSEYLAQHTAGMITRNTEVRMRFSRDVVDPQLLDTEWTSALEISPAVDGVARFRSPRELVFQPNRGFQPGTRYTFRLLPGAIDALPDDLGPYAFTIDILKQAFELQVDAASADPEDRRLAKVTGQIRTSDKAADIAVEAMLRASYMGEQQAIGWSHSTDGRLHFFSIAGLERPASPTDLTLAWNGGAIEVEEQGERAISIPVRGVFGVTSQGVVEGSGGNQVVVRFSEALDPNQNINGLVRIGNDSPRVSISGNMLTVYPEKPLAGTHTLIVSPGVRNEFGEPLGGEYRAELRFMREPPKIRFTGSGVILPAGEYMEVPFEAVNVDSVQVTAFQVFENNIGQFLQGNNLDGTNELSRVGRYLWRKTIPLKNASPDEWNRYALDVSELAQKHPGALFRLTLSIHRGNSIYACSTEDEAIPVPPPPPLANNEALHVVEHSSWDYAETWYGGQAADRNWRDRNDPCKDAYYSYSNQTKAARNFLGSNIGLLAKHGNDGSFLVLATDLSKGTPLAETSIEVRNFQNQPLATLKTDDRGMATAALRATPFYIVAKNANQTGYLKLSRGSTLPTSHMDVGGQSVEQGVKGFIYGERGVWRPGDDLHLTLALHDPENVIPDDHPVTMQLINPRGQIVQTLVNREPLDGFYAFTMATPESALTGNWTAKAMLGNKTFTHTVKIETVMPNRLSLELTSPTEELERTKEPVPFALDAQWLHGATAANLNADVQVRYQSVPTRFSRFSDFQYDDPIRSFASQPVKLWEGMLDDKGHAEFSAKLTLPSDPPGALKASFTSRVFEPGGAFSSNQSSMPYHPFNTYVGIKLPKGDASRNMLLTDTDHTVQIATLNARGEPVSTKDIEVSLYKLDWKWWWDKSAYTSARFENALYHGTTQQDRVSTVDGKGEWKFNINYPEWGRFLIRACDKSGGHCTGSIFYIDWPGWAGRAQEQAGPAASMLALTSDKSQYVVGETARVELPANASGRALLTVENGSGILEQSWLELNGESRSQVEIPIRAGMAPNVYVSVTLIQPHAGRDNDRPIRLFGVIPLMVDDPATSLEPVLESADVWQPRSEVSVKIAEKNGQPMTYTLAVVDEGLLGLTNFKAPHLRKAFYQREALGVMTWDLFDQVVGAYGADLERLLALGGSDSAEKDPASQKENRFKPVVRFFGPFRLAAGVTAEQKFEIPQYVGALRVMAVAGHSGAYGTTEKRVTVREPLSTLVTLPRVLGPGEELDVPVSLFVFDDTLQEATVRLDIGDKLEISGPAEQQLTLDGRKEITTRFRVRVPETTGRTQITAIVSSGRHESRSTTHLEIRAASQPEQRIFAKRLAPGEDWQQVMELTGLEGTNTATLGLTTAPPFGLDHRLDFLIHYPYGCLEQTTSGAMPQLYLPKLVRLTEKQAEDIERFINAAIMKLRGFQHANGGFNYWPGGGSTYNDWADTYAGNFLVEASNYGYGVPADMLNTWLTHASTTAQQWTASTTGGAMTQAYRLYVLALANKPDVGAMNRLRESTSLSRTGRWLLASAYAQIGLDQVANELLNGPTEVENQYSYPGSTYGSELRDKAILLNALVLGGNNEAALGLSEDIARVLSSDQWHSTQGIAFGLSAMGRFVAGAGAGSSVQAKFSAGGKQEDIQTDKPLASIALPVDDSGQPVSVMNNGDSTLFASLVLSGTPRPGTEQAVRGKLAVDVVFTDNDGNSIDITRLEQGQDIVARITVNNRSDLDLDTLALKYVVPSGWEISNERMAGGDQTGAEQFDYRDIRDDRVYTHFGMKRNESRSFTLRFTAAYAGRFFAPGIVFEDMYDNTLSSRTAGNWIEVLAR